MKSLSLTEDPKLRRMRGDGTYAIEGTSEYWVFDKCSIRKFIAQNRYYDAQKKIIAMIVEKVNIVGAQRSTSKGYESNANKKAKYIDR